MTLFFALLAMLCLGLIVVVIVSWLFDRTDRWGIRAWIRPFAVPAAAAVAVTATLGSLYLSEVAHYPPCQNCWIQRGFMYPAALVLVAAAITRRRALVMLGGALAVGGLPVSIYHRYEQITGSTGFCDLGNPCSTVWVREFGFMTIPTMAGIGFLTIIVLTAVYLTGRRP
ncbi:MAG: disulfide bond formation protein B [Acidimicrobiales bacterium]